MADFSFVGQPSLGTTLEAISDSIQSGPVSVFTSAVAYVTTRGLHSLEQECLADLRLRKRGKGERWLTSFDYLRTEPVALDVLRSRPNSSVRIFDGKHCLRRNGIPKVPFHPKLYYLEGASHFSLVLGSGNLSYSGLSKGIEAGMVVRGAKKDKRGSHSTNLAADVLSWFNKLWNDSDVLDDDLLDRYFSVYESRKNLLTPTPTEDDTAASSGRSTPFRFSATDLQKLRMCRHLWIDTGNVTKNLGDDRPGNQLMMRRLTRVFFGVPQDAVPQNSPLDSVVISFGNHSFEGSLTFSDNSMDKITLPIPGNGGPASYDNKTLLFVRTGTRNFDLRLATSGERRKWAARSERITARFQMKRGANAPERWFGVY